MGKAGWQVVAAISVSLAALFGAVAFNNSRALEVANAELRKRAEPPECPTPQPEPQQSCLKQRQMTDADIKALYEDHKRTRARLWQEHFKAGTARCIDGVTIFKDADGGIRSGGPC